MAELHLVMRGDRTNPAIVFVHAMGTDHQFWDEVIVGLSGEYFCIAPDLQGAGRTPNPARPLTAEEHSADLDEVVREAGLDRVVLVGCAIGGMLAAVSAANSPGVVTGLVMANPGVRNAEQHKIVMQQRVGVVREHGMQALLPAAAERAFHTLAKDYHYQLYMERFAAQDLEGYALSVTGFLDIDITEALQRVRCPLLLVPGGQDILMEAESAARIGLIVPQAEVIQIEDGAHFIPFQMPDRFLEVVRPFLAVTTGRHGPVAAG